MIEKLIIFFGSKKNLNKTINICFSYYFILIIINPNTLFLYIIFLQLFYYHFDHLSHHHWNYQNFLQ